MWQNHFFFLPILRDQFPETQEKKESIGSPTAPSPTCHVGWSFTRGFSKGRKCCGNNNARIFFGTGTQLVVKPSKWPCSIYI